MPSEKAFSAYVHEHVPKGRREALEICDMAFRVAAMTAARSFGLNVEIERSPEKPVPATSASTVVVALEDAISQAARKHYHERGVRTVRSFKRLLADLESGR